MDRRNFSRTSGALAAAWTAGRMPALPAPLPLMASDGGSDDNPNLADGRLGATPTASSVSTATPFSYRPTRVFGPNLNANWETDGEARGAWLQVDYPQEMTVGEVWLLPKPVPYDIVFDPYTRGGRMQTPRKVTCTLGGGASVSAEIIDSGDLPDRHFPAAAARHW